MKSFRAVAFACAAMLSSILAGDAAAQVTWSNHAGDPSHTAISSVASQPLQTIRWQMPVDLDPQYSGSYLLIHYGSPLVTAQNTVVVPVKTGATEGFRLEGRSGATGAPLWTATTDYRLPPHDWTIGYTPTIAPTNDLYYPGAGGTVYKRGNLDSGTPTTPSQLAFFGLTNYNNNPTAYNNNVFINTPITSDNAGNIYFGYQVVNSAAVGGLQSGLAKITPSGTASFVSAASLAPAGDTTIRKIAHSCAPAISPDGSKVYFAVSTASGTGSGNGYLVGLNTSNLSMFGRVDLRDVAAPGNRATLHESGSASPTIGPNGDVFYGVLESPFSSARGWMLQFNANLTTAKTPGSFGWDSTSSIVPRSMVPSYTGTSDYLIMTKYNNYAGLGGDGVNKIAILDPNATQIDPRTGATVMKEVLTIAGPTPDPEYIATHPNAVREWCINTAAVDPQTHSVLVNNEDGKLYRWDLWSNTLSQVVPLTAGLGQAYTPTIIGADGTVYAINDATLFAVGAVPEPSSLVLGGLSVAALAWWGRRRSRVGCPHGHCGSADFGDGPSA